MNKKIYKVLLLATAVAAIATIIVLTVRFATQNTAAPAQQATAGTTALPASVPVEADLHESTAFVPIGLPEAEDKAAAFNGSYKPDTRAEDVQTGANVHLRELFGTGYSGAAFTFSDDGTFSDTLSGRAGAYQIENGIITAIAYPDQELTITVTEWKADGTTPQRFCVIYKMVGDKGYKVTYAEK